jgi:Spy/CpxP family protein refolding chaperone
MRTLLFAVLVMPAGLLVIGGAGAQEEKKEKKGLPPTIGTVIPPFVRDKLKLTNDQERQLASLESSMHDKLAKVLSEDQMKKFEAALQEGPPKGGKEKKGPPPKDGRDGPPMLLIPPFVEGKLELTAAQRKQITELDYSARTGLAKILTATQRKQFSELLKRGPDDMPGKDDGPGGGRPPQGRNGPEVIPPPASIGAALPAAGIQWFATWESRLQEAKRSGRPIFLVAAAPHCAGVSGIW